MRKILSTLLVAAFAASMAACAVDLSTKHDCDKPCCKKEAAEKKECCEKKEAAEMKDCCKAKVAAGEKPCCDAPGHAH